MNMLYCIPRWTNMQRNHVMIKQAFRVARSLFVVSFRRMFRGPKRPSWPWLYEVVLDVVTQTNLHPAPTLEAQRADFDRLGQTERKRNRVAIQETTEPGVPCLLLTPPNKTDRLLLYFHGGAYVLGSPESHLPIAVDLALETGATVCSVHYRLAPEHTCPAPIEDALKVYDWACQQTTPSSILLAGDSAGGGLSVATLVAIRDSHRPQAAGAILFSPWADLTMETIPPETPPDCDYVIASGLHKDAQSYAGSLPRHDPRVSPVFADLTDLPPLLILCGADELLLHDSKELAKRAREAGVESTLDIATDEIHVYPFIGDLSPQKARAMALVRTFVAAQSPGQKEGT